MKSNRSILLALLMSASVLSLTGCFGSSKVTAPNAALNQTPPAAPTNVHSSYDAIGNRDYLNWDASASSNVTSYEVWVYEADPAGGATGSLVGDVNVGQNYLPLPVVDSAVTQFYTVRAVGNNGLSSAFSNATDIVRHPWVAPTGGPNGNPHGGTIDPTE